ncbi:TPA: hypothetical protein GDC93_10705 [Legionella pneumophila]|uniref:Uncharacterized protein n=1 Tax=Legionella pneumophila TaxID=446 RepID=A0AAN5Q3C5_LEGPN|nr:hypothetical protein DI137_08530 [Legionella pneumophila]HAT8307289.1 hypothetical protein [Legionella pneumophila]HAT8319206.1 hypothetical protein [Legionella pneumophila]HAT8339927.1 hypothetical protein [Legionella pneumophila]HAT8349796.1 hypothetical protein [Legionella pneumophila]
MASKFIPVNAYFLISSKHYCFYYLLKKLTKFYTTYIKSPIFLKENEIFWQIQIIDYTLYVIFVLID